MRISELTKDILICGTILFTDGIYNAAPVIYPYLVSYYLKTIPDLTMNTLYSIFIFLPFGRIFANYTLSWVLFFFGCKGTFSIGGVLYFLNFYCWVTFPCYLNLFISSFFQGFIYQFKMIPINFLMSKKYEKGLSYLDHIYTGFSVSTLVWCLVAVYLINPNNVEPEPINGEKLFQFEVGQNVYYYYIYQGFFSMLVIIGASHFLNNPQDPKPQINNFLKKLFGKINEEEKIEYEESFQKIKETNKTNSLDQSISYCFSKETPLVEKNDLEEYKKTADKESKALKFYILILIVILKTASSGYFYVYCKIISYDIVNNDKLVSVFFSFAAIPDLSARYLLIYLFKKLKFFNTMIISISFSIFLNLFFILYAYHDSLGFMVLIFLQIFNFATIFLLNNLALFSLYQPEVAVYLSKIYEFNSLFGRIYVIFVINVFMSENNYRIIFFIFVLGEILAIVLFVKYFSKIKVREI